MLRAGETAPGEQKTMQGRFRLPMTEFTALRKLAAARAEERGVRRVTISEVVQEAIQALRVLRGEAVECVCTRTACPPGTCELETGSR